MKHKNKLLNLKARQDAWSRIDKSKVNGYKKPGSEKK